MIEGKLEVLASLEARLHALRDAGLDKNTDTQTEAISPSIDTVPCLGADDKLATLDGFSLAPLYELFPLYFSGIGVFLLGRPLRGLSILVSMVTFLLALVVSYAGRVVNGIIFDVLGFAALVCRFGFSADWKGIVWLIVIMGTLLAFSHLSVSWFFTKMECRRFVRCRLEVCL